MDENSERRRYYPDDEETPISEAIMEAVGAHESASLSADEFTLYDHVNPDAIDSLFTDATGVSISVRISLPNVTVSVWNDGGIDIRVTERIE